MAPEVGCGEEGSGGAAARKDGRERRGLLRKAGEEAGTKLLLPMIIMLVIVMIVIMIPAYMAF